MLYKELKKLHLKGALNPNFLNLTIEKKICSRFLTFFVKKL